MSTTSRLDAARLALAGLFVACAVASAAWTFGPTWRWLSAQHRQYAGDSAFDRQKATGYAYGLPVIAFEFFRSRLRPGDRYYVAAAPGSFIAGVDKRTGLATFARWYLLPAIQVGDAHRADTIVSVGVDPATLGLTYSEVVQSPDGPFWFARVQR